MRKICLFNGFCEIILIQFKEMSSYTETEFPTSSAFHFFFFFNDDNIEDVHVRHA